MATAILELLAATRPNVIIDLLSFSMWAHGNDASYVPELTAGFDRVSRATPARRFAGGMKGSQTATTHSTLSGVRTRASPRCCRCCRTLPSLHIDTTNTSPDKSIALVERFIQI
jgi:hypothetical protein